MVIEQLFTRADESSGRYPRCLVFWIKGGKRMKKASKEVREFLAAAGKKGGKKKSAAKTAAARVNIKKRWEGK